MGSVGVEPTPMDFQSIASTELAYFPYYGTVAVPQWLGETLMPNTLCSLRLTYVRVTWYGRSIAY